MKERNYTVYKHTSPNGKVYIGITRQKPEKRWANGLGYKGNTYFELAIRKYGWNNIEHEILYTELTKKEAEEKEVETIALYKSNQRKYGYNIEAGGNSVGKASEESKLKNSIAHKGKQTWLGRRHSDESKKKMSETKKGRTPWNKGKKWDETTIQKLKEKCVCHPRKVICTTTGKVFESTKAAAEYYNMKCRSDISLVCRKKQKHAGRLKDGTQLSWEYCE